MDEKDKKEVKEVFTEAFHEIWEQNIAPGIEAIVDAKLEEKLDAKLEEKLDEKLAPLPTKSYIDDKFANLEGDIVVKLRKEDQKVNRLLDLLKQKKVLTEGELAELAALEVFPKRS